MRKIEKIAAYEAVVWVNEEGSMTGYGDTEEEAEGKVRLMIAEAEQYGWKVTGNEVNKL